jgi:hypothetical protein
MRRVVSDYLYKTFVLMRMMNLYDNSTLLESILLNLFIVLLILSTKEIIADKSCVFCSE